MYPLHIYLFNVRHFYEIIVFKPRKHECIVNDRQQSTSIVSFEASEYMKSFHECMVYINKYSETLKCNE